MKAFVRFWGGYAWCAAVFLCLVLTMVLVEASGGGLLAQTGWVTGILLCALGVRGIISILSK
jgi:hypothetical protein